jgi:YidC/Oxa1 family membrane protein insertase
MSAFIKFFHIILWQPLFNLLVLFYNYLPGRNLGIAIIALTLLIRIILYPLQDKATKSQLALQSLQPKLKEIQNKYKNNKEAQAKAMMQLYKTEKINPFSSFLILLIQFPILIVLYRLFWQGIQSENFQYLYSFVSQPETINSIFLGANLNEPSLIMAVLAGLAFFFQAKFNAPKTDNKKKLDNKAMFGQMFQKQMVYVFPIFLVFILAGLPAALGLYLLISGALTAIQQYFIKKKYTLEKENVQ